MRTAIVLAWVVATGGGARAERHWLRANFHAHAMTEHVDDDGAETAAQLHRAVRAAGFDFSLHTPHCVKDQGAAGAQRYLAQRAAESQINVPGLTIALGEELSVVDGPSYARHTMVLGRPAPGNLNHLTILGNKQLLPYRQLTPGQACERVHQDGGVCIVNHAGPGPMMWEEGYWEAPANRGHIDGLEVYNGQALGAVGIDFETRYREATSYRGLGLKIAATTGADTHGPESVAKTQSRLAGFAGPARKLVHMMLPSSASARPELDVATLVQVDGGGDVTTAVIAAIKARRTIATNALPNLTVTLAGLGETRHTREVHLALALSRPLGEVTLYREGVAVQTWHDTATIDFAETIATPAAYVFGARDGATGRLLTSAIWYEPPK
ncbi:MAG TPA: hypothetical protein VHB97_17780 [Polyangia bacterium]|nr:hypothetical protein [Polyangia bacterium]